MVKIAAYRNNFETEQECTLDVALQSFKQLIGKLKSTRKNKNPIAYFYGVLDNKFEDLFVKELMEMRENTGVAE